MQRWSNSPPFVRDVDLDSGDNRIRGPQKKKITIPVIPHYQSGALILGKVVSNIYANRILPFSVRQDQCLSFAVLSAIYTILEMKHAEILVFEIQQYRLLEKMLRLVLCRIQGERPRDYSIMLVTLRTFCRLGTR